MSQEEKLLPVREIQEFLRKCAKKQTSHSQRQFSNVLVWEETGVQYRPAIYLKRRNQFLPCNYLKMEGINRVQNLLR